MGIKFKKITRNLILKTAVLVLCVFTICFSAIPFMELVPEFDQSSMSVEELMSGDYLSSYACYYYQADAVQQFLLPILDYRTSGKMGSLGESQKITKEYGEAQIRSWKEELSHMEGIVYYAQAGDLVVKNIDEETPEEFGFTSRPTYIVIDCTTNVFSYIPKSYNVSYFIRNRYNDTDAVESAANVMPDSSQYRIYVSLSDDYIAQQVTASRNLSQRALSQIETSSLLLGIGLLCLVYLCAVCGRKPQDEEIHHMVIDRTWSEIILAFIILWPILIIFAAAALFIMAHENDMINMVKTPITIGLVLSVSLWLAVLCSMVRNIKDRQFLKKSAVLQFCRWFFKSGKNIFRGVFTGITQVGTLRFRTFWLAALVIGVHFVAGMVCVGIPYGMVVWLMGMVAFDFFFLKRLGVWTMQLEQISKGIESVRNGNLEHKIEVPETGILRDIALNANGVAEGLSSSVQKEVKAERMKAELITNVSHDLKTPLTAIINYAELLGKETLSPEVANDYVRVIRKKSEKLKSLTQDLFDISKAQSGNVDIKAEQLDLSELIRQAAGEAEERMKEANLDCRLILRSAPAMIMADGRLLSRAVENLIGNILKYAMPNTRVYIEVMCQNNRASVQFKNIANYEMNFMADEVAERFTRGDAARTTEGSGLGLAIAKSYVEACGGRMLISVDGDLFKVTLGFEQTGVSG